MTSANEGVIGELFRPYFEHLIEILISKGQLPENENVFTSEDKEIFRCYRSDIIETMVNEESISNKRFYFKFRCVCIMFFVIELWKVS